MAFQVADRVKETSTTTGTGTLNLGGAPDTYETFVAGVGGGNTTYYSIANRAANEWEVGIGTVTDAATDTLSRDTVISSSNSDALVDFSAGTKDVICTLPSSKSYVLDNSGDTTISADLSVTSVSGSGAGLTTLNASNLASGTLPDARFPATLPAISGANLTNLDADDLASGTVPDARFPATLPAASGANLTGLNASNLASGTVPDARFPATIPASSGANLTNLNASNVSSGTLSSDRLPTVPTTKGGTGLTAIGTANQVLAVNSGGTALEFQTISADIEGVTAGNGLTGGGTSGTVTLNVGAGTGIDVTADAVAVDVSDFMTNGSNNRVLTATGTDGMNAEANMTFDGSTLAVTGGATFTANVSLGDSDYLRLGAGNDLQIYHDGSNSYIDDQGTGDLIIRARDLAFKTPTDEVHATFINNAAVSLYYDNNKKFETTSSGISITGTVVESSSIAYKENVQPLDFNDAIYSVNAVKYDRKDGSSKDEVGVIAEELYKVLPDLVECKDGKPEAVKYTKMTMYLLEALKKQNQEIQELKRRLN